ncbi:MAG: hypothetical protein ACMUIE_07110 [Thermoplasmatota archaeon]
MARKKRKTVKSAPVVNSRGRLIIRAFGLSHLGGYTQKDLEKLQAYLHDMAAMDLTMDDLEKWIVKEVKRTEVERQLRDIDRQLFAPDLDEEDIKLGSGFCPECGMFKRFRKECPWCGFLEMTFGEGS